MKEAGGQIRQGILGITQDESSMAGSGEPVGSDQVRAELQDDSSKKHAGSWDTQLLE